jgi:soluble lytic murein transglycosylase
MSLAAPQAIAVPLPKPRPIPRTATTTAKPVPTKAETTATLPPPATTKLPPAPPVAAAVKPARRDLAPLAAAQTSATSDADQSTLEQVIGLVRAQKPVDATQAENTISDPVARKLAEWIILRSNDNGAGVERYVAFLSQNPSWPSQTFLRRRAESSLWDDKRDDATVLAYFDGNTPLSGKGRFVLARALLARGDRAGAERLVREAWRGDTFSRDIESAALDQFSPLLTAADQRARMEFLLFNSDNEGAMRAATRLGGPYPAIAKARIAVGRKAGNAKALLDAVPLDAREDPGYLFARILWLRQNDKDEEAARLMLSASREPSRLVNLDEWWKQRRALSRDMLDAGDNRTAYLLVRDAAVPPNDIYKTEQDFMAGWIALRFLNDPATAAQHFARIGVGSVNPTRLGKAGYWQGRAAEAMGRTEAARAAYESAARFSTDYYGQLARARLGLPQIALHGVPGQSRNASQLEIVRAVGLLYALEENEMAIPILNELGERGDDPDAVAALAELAGRYNDAHGQLVVGKAALNAGLPFDFYAYPVTGIPAYQQLGPEVERSVVYAIARQESAFDQSVVSPANAYGLMQVTPDAGEYVSRKYGASFDRARMKTDASYNTTLGAAELGGLIDDYRGSYIMTFAGYNAGRGSVKKWIAKYGDPRDPNVDPVDWVERIPFAETRNYVQRIMENVQVYRSRFGGGNQLMIEADLKRGSSTE